QRHTLLRKAMKPLLDDHPETLVLAVYGSEDQRAQSAYDAYYVATLNTAELPSRKRERKTHALGTIHLHGWQHAEAFSVIDAQVAGNTLARSLTLMPPNELTPAAYRQRIAELATAEGWQHREYDFDELQQ